MLLFRKIIVKIRSVIPLTSYILFISGTITLYSWLLFITAVSM